MAQGESETGFEQLAKLLAPQLIAERTDENGVSTGKYCVDDATLAAYLAKTLDSDLADIDRMADILSGIVTAEEIAEMIEDAWSQADYESHEDTRPTDPSPRELHIIVGAATGAAFVQNEGDIILEQAEGTLTAGAIHSKLGDVSLTAKNGAIEGSNSGQTNVVGKEISLAAKAGIGANTPLTIEQRVYEPTLVGNVTKPAGEDKPVIKPIDADGKPTSEADKEESPRENWGMETEITFDWIRVEHPEKATKLNITAGGNVNVIEQTGDMGLGEIHVTGGDVSLTAPGSMVDTRSEDQTNANLVVDGNVTLEAKEGAIGTEAERITTDVDGVIKADAKGSISIADEGSLDLIADSEEGQVNASAKDDLNLSNTDGDLTVGPIEAGGTARIEAEGSLIEGDRHGRDAQVIAGSIDLTAKDGDIGTSDNAFDVDTDAENGGTLSASGNFIHISEKDGDLILKDIDAADDAVISAPGDILDANQNAVDSAVDKQKEANNAKAEADAAETEAFIRTEEAKRAEEAMREAEEAANAARENTEESLREALDAAKDALNGMNPETEAEEIAEQQKRIEELEKQLDKAIQESEARDKALEEAEKALADAIAKNKAAQDAADAANAEVEQKRVEAEAKQAEADKAKDEAANRDATVNVGNDLTLNAGGNIGSDDNGLSVSAGGDITANAGADLDGDGIADGDGENIHISGKGDLSFNEISVPGHVDIGTVDGTITGNGVISSGSLDVNAVDGDVGKKENPLHVSTDHVDAMGDNVYIRNDRDTEIGQISADGEVKIDSNGDVTGDGTTKPNIIAGDTTINADGDIGSKDQPLDTSTGGFHGSGDDVNIDNSSKDLEISDVDADRLDVKTDGNVTGSDNKVHDILIDAGGYVGAPEDPFTFTADGKVDIHGELGTWYRNLYAPNVDWEGTVLVLRFDVTIDDRAYSLYAFIGFEPDGGLRLIAFFLCEGEADEAFWLSVFETLKESLNVIDLTAVIYDGENGLPVPLRMVYEHSACIDLSERGESVRYHEALTETLKSIVENPEAADAEVKAFEEALQEALADAFDCEAAALEAAAQLTERFTAERESWIDFER